jgi:TIR domain
MEQRHITEDADAPPGDVFISYARENLAFAEKLVDALVAIGSNAYLDKKDILPGEPWKERLGGLIESADSVVFILSPDSIDSETCAWEVNEAERLSKRILPIVCAAVDDNKVPGRLRRLNWIFFTDGHDFQTELFKLHQALLTDIAWMRESSRLVVLAEHWVRSNRSAEQLMSPADIKATERLLETRPRNADPVPQALIDFRDASRHGSKRIFAACAGQLAVASSSRLSKRLRTGSRSTRYAWLRLALCSPTISISNWFRNCGARRCGLFSSAGREQFLRGILTPLSSLHSRMAGGS